ncbi:MAG: hypothetical protein H6667_07520 [Ardenticatenaceae bacterium]|nr:hypothetical protein [Ardenticatenaceae bacterium]MCB9443900.1 hypothetical protein [Ardenticatenaceae bacterium]
MKNIQKTTIWLRTLVVFAILLAALSLTGCGSKEPAPVAETGATEAEIAVAEVQATETAVAANEVDVAEVVAEETAVTEAPTDECLACHIDKEMLIATAAPEEEVISENEGEG